MQIHLIIVNISLIIWLIVPIVYRKNRHFYYFLFLGLNDFLLMVLWFLFSIFVQELWIITHSLILLLFDRYYIKKIKNLIFFSIIPLLALAYFSNSFMQSSFALLTHIILVFLFTRLLIQELYKKHYFNRFYFVLIFYELITIYKFIAFQKVINGGVEIFYIGTIIQILIGLYLIFRNSRNYLGGSIRE